MNPPRSAFKIPKPELKGFEENRESRMSSMFLSSSASKAVPDTPQRKPAKKELTEKKLLLSSSKKPRLHSSLLRSGTPVSTQHKRYKDAETSPLKATLQDVSPKKVNSPFENDSEKMEEEMLAYGDLEEDDEDDDDLDIDEELPADIPICVEEKVLGDGQFGKVTLVRCKNNNRKYALKEVKQYLSESRRRSALDELRLWDSLKHRNVVQFLRAWQEDARLYILMQFCEDGNLDQFVKYNGGIDENVLLSAFKDCCSALAFLHTTGCVHMDIKPKNICLSKGRAMLGDMGSLKREGSIWEGETDNMYVALEINTREYQVRSSADIFSLGISFLELTGVDLPLNGQLWHDLRKNYSSFSELPRLCSMYPFLMKYVEHCMSQNPGRRPKAADLMQERPVKSAKAKLSPTSSFYLKPISTRPDSASLVSPSHGFHTISFFDRTSPRLPLSRVPSRAENVSWGHRLDFSSITPIPGLCNSTLDESALSDRFTTQAVVTPRPGSNLSSCEHSRASSPRNFTSSPVFLYPPVVPTTDRKA